MDFDDYGHADILAVHDLFSISSSLRLALAAQYPVAHSVVVYFFSRICYFASEGDRRPCSIYVV